MSCPRCQRNVVSIPCPDRGESASDIAHAHVHAGGCIAPMSSLAVAGFVVAFFVGVIGFALSWSSYCQIEASGGAHGGRGLSIAGMAIGLIVSVAQVIWWLA